MTRHGVGLAHNQTIEGSIPSPITNPQQQERRLIAAEAVRLLSEATACFQRVVELLILGESKATTAKRIIDENAGKGETL